MIATASNEAMTKAPELPFELSVCICTRNRPVEVVRAVESVLASVRSVHEIVVSDDSTDAATRTAIEAFGDRVAFVEGPRRGLCANRNTALDRVTGTHVLFIDDDVILAPDFVDEAADALNALGEPARGRTIIVGLERKHGKIVFPSDQSFWGYQTRQYRLGAPLNTIVINAAVFPAPLFKEIRFDETLVYGSDEVDLATRAVQRGYVLSLCLQAINDHFPAAMNRDYYAPFIDASRLYVTFKRYYLTDRRPAKAFVYALLAPLHLFASRLRSRPRTAAPVTLHAVRLAAVYLSRGRWLRDG